MSKRDRLVFMARVAPPSRRWIPAWPKAWDAEFKLLARGGFVVTAAIRGGEIQPLEIASRLGEECRIRAPWPGPCRVTTVRGEPVAHEVSGGDLLTFLTERGERYRLHAR
jgi:alpha-L-fucosidase 2